jgi:hypothetical protein
MWWRSTATEWWEECHCAGWCKDLVQGGGGRGRGGRDNTAQILYRRGRGTKNGTIFESHMAWNGRRPLPFFALERALGGAFISPVACRFRWKPTHHVWLEMDGCHGTIDKSAVGAPGNEPAGNFDDARATDSVCDVCMADRKGRGFFLSSLLSAGINLPIAKQSLRWLMCKFHKSQMNSATTSYLNLPKNEHPFRTLKRKLSQSKITYQQSRRPIQTTDSYNNNNPSHSRTAQKKGYRSKPPCKSS